MIVVDTNIIAYMIFPGDYTKTVESLHEFDSHWEVPFLWRSEFLNVVSLYFRKNMISYPEALDAFEKGSRLVGDREHEVSAFATLELIQNSVCSSYDCEFVALAVHLGVNLITYDKQVLNGFPTLALKPEDYIRKNYKKE